MTAIMRPSYLFYGWGADSDIDAFLPTVACVVFEECVALYELTRHSFFFLVLEEWNKLVRYWLDLS